MWVWFLVCLVRLWDGGEEERERGGRGDKRGEKNREIFIFLLSSYWKDLRRRFAWKGQLRKVNVRISNILHISELIVFYIFYTYKSKFPLLANDSIVFVKTLEILFPNIAKLFILNICCSQQEWFAGIEWLQSSNQIVMGKYFISDRVRFAVHLVICYYF